MKRRLALLCTTLIVGAMGMAGCSSASVQDGGISQGAAIIELPPGQRPVAPAIAGTTLQGAAFNVTSWHGDVIVVNFFGSWCAPCMEEAPGLQKVYTATKAHRVRFLGVTVRDTAGGALAYAKHYGLTYPSLLDDGSIVLGFRGALAMASPPTTYILDTRGRIAVRVLGPVDDTTLTDLIADVRHTSA